MKCKHTRFRDTISACWLWLRICSLYISLSYLFLPLIIFLFYSCMLTFIECSLRHRSWSGLFRKLLHCQQNNSTKRWTHSVWVRSDIFMGFGRTHLYKFNFLSSNDNSHKGMWLIYNFNNYITEFVNVEACILLTKN